MRCVVTMENDTFYSEAEDIHTLAALRAFDDNWLSSAFFDSSVASWLPLPSPGSLFAFTSDGIGNPQESVMQHKAATLVPAKATDHIHPSCYCQPAPSFAAAAHNTPRTISAAMHYTRQGNDGGLESWTASLLRRNVPEKVGVLSTLLVEKQARLSTSEASRQRVVTGRERVLQLVTDTRKEQMARLSRPASAVALYKAVALCAMATHKPIYASELAAVKEHGWNISASVWMRIHKLLVDAIETTLLPPGKESVGHRLHVVMKAVGSVYAEIFVRCADSFIKMSTMSAKEWGVVRPSEDELWCLQCQSINLSQRQVEDIGHLHDLYCAWSGAVTQQRRQLCSELSGALGSGGHCGRDSAEVVEALSRNVLQERCLLALTYEVLCYRLLDPAQMAMIMIISYPFCSDAPTALSAMAKYHAALHHGIEQ